MRIDNIHHGVYAESNMKRTQIYLPQSQLLTLRNKAQKQRTTVSGLIRRYIQIQIKENRLALKRRKSHGMESLFKLAEEFKQRGVKGPSDLAQNLDHYLYGEK